MLLLSLVLAGWCAGCAATGANGPDDVDRDGLRLSLATIRNEWFLEINRVNPQLHDTLLEALYLSRQQRREVFVHKRSLGTANATEPAAHLYLPSLVRGGPENVLSVDYASRTFLLDHYSEADGPTMEQVRDRLFDTRRIEEIKRDLGIFGVK